MLSMPRTLLIPLLLISTITKEILMPHSIRMVKQGIRAEDVDTKIRFLNKNGAGNWSSLPKKAGLKRCGKSCKLKWSNYSKTDNKHDSFTDEEEELIIKMHAAIGSRWPIIAQQLPGRTETDVKNIWNTKLRKKLSQMGIDHVTHKPISQILADYGTINQTLNPNHKTRTAFPNHDLHTFVSPRPDFYGWDPKTSCNNYHNAEFGPTDLLSQLQAIRFVSKATNYSSSSSLSSSSSSSNFSNGEKENAELNFSWREFLLDEEIFQENIIQEGVIEENEEQDLTGGENGGINQNGLNREILGNDAASSNNLDASSSTENFLEAIFDQENDMILGFPGFLDNSIYD